MTIRSAPMLSHGALCRIIASLIATACAGGNAGQAAGWTAQTAPGAAGLALDSLELRAASASVSRFFRLHETGADENLLAAADIGAWAHIVEAALASGAITGFTFTTAGTTGPPKLCPQTIAALRDEALFWSGRLGGCDRVVTTVAPHHIYGCVFTALLPDFDELPVLDARLLPPGALREALRPGDLLIGHPSGLAAMLPFHCALPRGLRVTSAAATLPAATHRHLQLQGAAEVIDIYGSAETAGIAARHDPDRPFKLLPRWRRDAARAGLVEHASGTAFALPDPVTWHGRRLLRPAARTEGAVRVAGVNVFPARIAARLAAHPMVAACAVQLDSSLAPPRLRARIVPAAGLRPEAVAASCVQWARRRFNAPERPVSFEMVTEPADDSA